MPLGRWFNNDKGMGAYLESLAENSLICDYFQSNIINKIIGEHRNGYTDHSDILWALVNFKLWRQQFNL